MNKINWRISLRSAKVFIKKTHSTLRTLKSKQQLTPALYSNIKTKMRNIPILYYIIFAFQAHFSFFLGCAE